MGDNIQCYEIIPENILDHGPTRNEDGEVVPHVEIVPEHRCPEDGLAMARDLEEVQFPGVHGTSLKITEERHYCGFHAKPGVITFLDGHTNDHAVMSSNDRTLPIS